MFYVLFFGVFFKLWILWTKRVCVCLENSFGVDVSFIATLYMHMKLINSRKILLTYVLRICLYVVLCFILFLCNFLSIFNKYSKWKYNLYFTIFSSMCVVGWVFFCWRVVLSFIFFDYPLSKYFVINCSTKFTFKNI